MTATWATVLAKLAEGAPVLLGIVICGYLVLLGLATGVATLHPEQDRRADARKVLKRLLLLGRREDSGSERARTLPPADGDEPPPAQVAAAREKGRARPRHRG